MVTMPCIADECQLSGSHASIKPRQVPPPQVGSVLDYLLLGTRAADLYKPLTDSGLGEEVIGGGLDVSLRQPTYSVGLSRWAQA